MTSRMDHRVGGRYELVRRIARGGGGTVWAGYDHLLERDVAVKHVQIPDDLPAPERERVRARVRSEARASARLLHPSAVAIFDVVADDGDVHLVLELVDDPTLDELIARDGPMDEVDAAAVGLKLLDVLMAAHERGIVHRDVKPSNIFVSSRGEVKLTDFGIASVEGEARLTQTGATMGSPQFIAPEQAVGHDAAPPVDLWGLGASLYLAVEGVPPFERSNAVATVHAVVHEPAREVERADQLAPVLARLLEKRPEDRPDEPWLREQLGRIAGDHSPPVEAAATTVIPVTSTPASGAEAVEDTPEYAGDAMTASVPVPPAAPAEDGATEVDAPADEGDTPERRRWVPVAVVLGLLALVGVVWLAAIAGGGDDPEDAGIVAPDGSTDEDVPEDADPEDTDPEDTVDPDPAPDAEAEGGGDDPDEAAADDAADTDEPETETADDGNAVPEADVPEDWQVVDGPAYQVAVPAGWQVQPGQGRIVDHRDPNSSTYLRVDWTPEPLDDPYANWEAQDRSLSQRFQDYERQQLTRVTFRGEPAALLEYTYTSGGTQLRAYNLNIRWSDDRAYALNLQSRAADWDQVEPMFASMVGGFQPDR